MKNAQVIWSDGALTDLEIIHDFLDEHSPSAAQKIVASILNRAKQLEAFPESGSRQETLKHNLKEYRYLVEGHYKVIYSFNSKNHLVYIEVIFDTRLNPEKLRV